MEQFCQIENTRKLCSMDQLVSSLSELSQETSEEHTWPLYCEIPDDQCRKCDGKLGFSCVSVPFQIISDKDTFGKDIAKYCRDCVPNTCNLCKKVGPKTFVRLVKEQHRMDPKAYCSKCYPRKCNKCEKNVLGTEIERTYPATADKTVQRICRECLMGLFS
jgi:hypothetical protein